MSPIDVQRFQQAFRLHPRTWRQQHEAAAVGVLLDVAESSGRSQPSFSERLSIYAHAASVWQERIVKRRVRDNLASLAFGTGIAVSVVYFAGFVLGQFVVMSPAIYEQSMPASKLVAGLLLVTPWLAAGALSAFGLSRVARPMAGIGLLVSVVCGAVRLLDQEVVLPSTFTLTFLGLWAVIVMIGRVRPRVLWPTVLILTVLLAAVLVIGDFVGNPVEGHFWVHLAYFSLFVLAGFYVCIATAAMCGRASFAIASTVYAAPWAAITTAGYLRDGFGGASVALMGAIWVLVSVIVIGTAMRRVPDSACESVGAPRGA